MKYNCNYYDNHRKILVCAVRHFQLIGKAFIVPGEKKKTTNGARTY